MTAINEVAFDDLRTNIMKAQLQTVDSQLHYSQTQQQQQPNNDTIGALSSKRVYFCQRCLNHGVLAPRKNHKCECIHAQCNCAKCILVERRRVLNSQLHDLEESEQQHFRQQETNHHHHHHQQQQHQQQQQVESQRNFFMLEQQQQQKQHQQQQHNETLMWNNALLCESLAKQMETQQIQQKEKHFFALQAMLLRSGFTNKHHVNAANATEPAAAATNQETTSGENGDAPHETMDEEECEIGNNNLTNIRKYSLIANDDILNDELNSFRSRNSTINSLNSNTTNSSSLTSEYSSATSPTAFSTTDGCNAAAFLGNSSSAPHGLGENYSSLQAFDTAMRLKGERVPNCQKCGQHGYKSRLKGHKRYCPFKNCGCAKCQVITERQKLMADQIKIRRRQCKDTLMRLKREKMSMGNYQQRSANEKCENTLAQQFSYEAQKNGSAFPLPSYWNSLNILCKQFNATPMLTPATVMLSTQISNPTMQLSSPLQLASDSLTKCSQINAAKLFGAQNPMTKTNGNMTSFSASNNNSQSAEQQVNVLNNLAYSQLPGSSLHTRAEFLRLIAARSMANGNANAALTFTPPLGAHVPVAAAAVAHSAGYACNPLTEPSVIMASDLNNHAANNIVNAPIGNSYSNLMLWEKTKAGALMKFIQQRQLINDVLLSAQQQQQHQQYQQQKAQQQKQHENEYLTNQELQAKIQFQQQQQQQLEQEKTEEETSKNAPIEKTADGNIFLQNLQKMHLLNLINAYNMGNKNEDVTETSPKASAAADTTIQRQDSLKSILTTTTPPTTTPSTPKTPVTTTTTPETTKTPETTTTIPEKPTTPKTPATPITTTTIAKTPTTPKTSTTTIDADGLEKNATVNLFKKKQYFEELLNEESVPLSTKSAPSPTSASSSFRDCMQAAVAAAATADVDTKSPFTVDVLV